MHPTLNIAPDEVDILLAEVEEHLQTLDVGLLHLEEAGANYDPAQIQGLFRAAHTLKGTAGMIGHVRMATLTHALETVWDQVRHQQLGITAPLINASLAAVDALKKLSAEITTHAAIPLEIEPLVAALQAAGNPAAGAVQWQIHLVIDPACALPTARALQVLGALREVGQVVRVTPPANHIEAGQPTPSITAVVASAWPQAKLQTLLATLADMQTWHLEPAPNEVVTPAEPAPLPTPPVAEPATPTRASKTIHANVERLDSLMNLMGELITDRNRLYQLRGTLLAEFKQHPSIQALADTIGHLSRIADQLQEGIMRVRLAPLASMFSKLLRVARDLTQQMGKQAELVVQGETTEVDRTVLAEINDPLVHLLRNAIDHGLETPAERVALGKPPQGKIQLKAWHEENHVIITLEDDGRGVDMAKVRASAVRQQWLTEEAAASLTPEAVVQLLFRPGFSTATTVSEVSGRGVGLDIVRANIEKLNGTVQMQTWPGRGTRFEIRLPLTLATQPVLLVQARNGRAKTHPQPLSTYALPLAAVRETLRLPPSAIHTVQGQAVIMLRDQVLPLANLSELLGYTVSDTTRPYEYIVVVHWHALTLGLVVEALEGEQEVVVKPLGAFVNLSPCLAGATILGDGQVALIVDVWQLCRLAGMQGERVQYELG